MAEQRETRLISVDVNDFLITRDSLISAQLSLSSALDRVVKAYLDHTQVVINGDASLNIGGLLEPLAHLGAYTNPAQLANAALQQQQLQNGEPVKSEEPEKKRKKRAYKQRDPDAPKRPLTAYFRFLGASRAGIAEEIAQDPVKFSDETGVPGGISKLATRRWKELSLEQQEPYKQAYRDELVQWQKTYNEYMRKKGLPVDAADLAEEDDETGIAEADEVEQSAAGAAPAKKSKAAAADSSSDSSSDDSSSDDSDSEPTPPPPKKATATPKKPAVKKSKTPATVVAAGPAPVNPTPKFSSINTPAPAPAPSSSPSRKRKSEAAEPEAKKKRGRKEKEVAAVPSSPPAAATVSSNDSEIVVADGGKKKKDKKEKKERKKKVKAGED